MRYQTVLQKHYYDVLKIADKAERQGDIYCIDSAIPSTLYMADDKRIMVLTHCNGYLSMKIENLPKIIEELQGIYSDLKFRKQMGIKGS